MTGAIHHEAARLIDSLNLQPHPEGGWYRETWRSVGEVDLPPLGARSAGTAIYYLLAAGQHSCFHRLAADEVWHLYRGGPVFLHLLEDGSRYRRLELGGDGGEVTGYQAVVPAGTWFAATLAGPAAFGLTGCTMAPGFHFEDFQLADRRSLLAEFSDHHEIIRRLTPEPGEDK